MKRNGYRKLLLPIILTSNMAFAETENNCRHLFPHIQLQKSKNGFQTKASLKLESIPLVISKGRMIDLKYLPAQNGKPTLLLLPGINRSFIESDQAVDQLKTEGFGIAIMNFSAQVFSINNLPKSEIAYFKENKMNLDDLLQEVAMTAEYLKSDLKVEEIIPITLSYSGMLSPFLDQYKTVIDTSPMTSSAAANPHFEKFKKGLELSQAWNPIFGPAIVRSQLDATYRMTWSPKIDAMVHEFGLATEKKNEMVESYVQLSILGENFSWPQLPENSTARRNFILGEKEAFNLKQDQLQVFLNMFEQNQSQILIIVEKSGHVIPYDHPVAYLEAIKISLNKKSKPGIYYLDENGKVQRFVDKSKVKSEIKKLLSSFS